MSAIIQQQPKQYLNTRLLFWVIFALVNVSCVYRAMRASHPELHATSAGLVGGSHIRNLLMHGMDASMSIVPDAVGLSCLDGCDETICATMRVPNVSMVLIGVRDSVDDTCRSLKTNSYLPYIYRNNEAIIAMSATLSVVVFVTGALFACCASAEPSPRLKRQRSSTNIALFAIFQGVVAACAAGSNLYTLFFSMWTDSSAQLIDHAVYVLLSVCVMYTWFMLYLDSWLEVVRDTTPVEDEEDEAEYYIIQQAEMDDSTTKMHPTETIVIV